MKLVTASVCVCTVAPLRHKIPGSPVRNEQSAQVVGALSSFAGQFRRTWLVSIDYRSGTA
jgi:hypothetical protein